jgi:acyl carrier protein
MALDSILSERPPQFCLLMSSNAATLGGLGSIAYSAANIFMDAFAASRNKKDGCRWISANWDGWLLNDDHRLSASYQTTLDQYAMSASESAEAFKRIISHNISGQVVVSTGDFNGRFDLWISRKGRDGGAGLSHESLTSVLHPRPDLGIGYVAPESEIEIKIGDIWQRLLGVEHLGVNDNFFELGGNSLICLRVISLFKKELKVDIPVVAIFEGPTIKSLAKLISQKSEDGPSPYAASHGRGERRKEKRRRKPLSTGTA